MSRQIREKNEFLNFLSPAAKIIYFRKTKNRISINYDMRWSPVHISESKIVNISLVIVIFIRSKLSEFPVNRVLKIETSTNSVKRLQDVSFSIQT